MLGMTESLVIHIDLLKSKLEKQPESIELYVYNKQIIVLIFLCVSVFLFMLLVFIYYYLIVV